MKFFTSLLLLFFTSLLYAQVGTGAFINGGLVHDGSFRTYVVYVPSAYDGTQDWPLVINYHETSVQIDQYIPVQNTTAVADTAHFLIAYPIALDGYILPIDSIAPNWNDGTPVGNAVVDDIGFTDRLIEQLSFNFRIDPARVYAMGMGGGGAMAAYAGCQLPDRLAAIANVQGFITCQPSREMPGLFMYGTADPVVPEGGIPGVLPPFIAGVEGWATSSTCGGTPTETALPDLTDADSSTIALFEYPECTANSEVIYYRIEGGGRTWPGGLPIPDSGPVNRDINADVEIWNFFNRHLHPGPGPLPKLLRKTITVDDLEREYLLYVPAAYDGSEAWPLVFNLHGATSNAASQIFISGMNQVADTAHFLVAYPEGISNPEGTSTGWNGPLLPDLQDDVKFIGHLLDTLMQDYAVDFSRVYSAGLSNGGGMSVTLACELPDRIAAIASVASPGNLADCNPGRAMPVLYIHGTDDIIVPFNGGISPVLQVPFLAVRDRIQLWLGNNDCAADSTLTAIPDINMTDNSTVDLIKFRQCGIYTGLDGTERMAEIWFYVVKGGGHTWPDGPDQQIPPQFAQFFGEINRDIIASSEIWNFFHQHMLPTGPNAVRRLDAGEINLQVYPNPFTTELSFDFELKAGSRVQLQLYNPLGQPVAQLVDQRFSAGKHRLLWLSDQTALAPGLYYYQLRIGDRLLSRAVVLGR